MLDVIALRQIFSVENAAWTVAIIIGLLVLRMWNGAPAMFAQWIAYKQARAAEKSADWMRLREEIGRLDGRCDHLQSEVDACHARELEWMHRAIKAESASEGLGDARQRAQEIISAERLKDRDTKKT